MIYNEVQFEQNQAETEKYWLRKKLHFLGRPKLLLTAFQLREELTAGSLLTLWLGNCRLQLKEGRDSIHKYLLETGQEENICMSGLTFF